ncbi:MAG: hypothetical protein M3Q23_05060 [Actinomycetota bacterium]|nr:hypothetical protein [Actinomycetota bacterium]
MPGRTEAWVEAVRVKRRARALAAGSLALLMLLAGCTATTSHPERPRKTYERGRPVIRTHHRTVDVSSLPDASPFFSIPPGSNVLGNVSVRLACAPTCIGDEPIPTVHDAVVRITGSGVAVGEVSTGTTGDFAAHLPPGRYTFQVVQAPDDIDLGTCTSETAEVGTGQPTSVGLFCSLATA